MALSKDMKLAIIRRKTRMNFYDESKSSSTIPEALEEFRADKPEYFEDITEEDIVEAFRDFRRTLA